MNILTIAGSDPSSGAGIQGDIRTFGAHGIYGLCVVTAITSQNTRRFLGARPVSPSLVKSQLRSVLEDFHIDAIKIGMVYDRQTIRAIHSEISETKAPIILDPIFESTTGGTLQRGDALSDFKRLLIPIAHTITPNAAEAEKISGIKIRSLKDMKSAAKKIQRMGARNVVVKGGHFLSGPKVTDILLAGAKFHIFSHDRIKAENHGGGCTFSAALCASIARGKSIADAVDHARLYTIESMKNAARVGSGLAITRPPSGDMIEGKLSEAISKFCQIGPIYQHIPECQTNFVYSIPNPSTLSDIMGLEGRIVRTGRSGTVAGQLRYGGSRHVASAVLEMSRKFPAIRSAVNLRYDDKTIKKALSRGLRVSSYDRNKEPSRSKQAEGSTVSWGIKCAIEGLTSPPDIVFHRGDFGKEAMILIFGKSPGEVLKKTLKVAEIHLSL